jgi:hypothetical protein
LFNNHVEDEADFCEAYKSQVLSNASSEEKSSNTLSKILTILLLLIIIVAVSIYGYNYMMKEGSDALPPSSIQMVEDDELVVTHEEEIPVEAMPPQIEDSDIDKMAKEVELAISKTEKNTTKEKKLENPLSVPTSRQAEYLEELAKLSEEIDKDRK